MNDYMLEINNFQRKLFYALDIVSTGSPFCLLLFFLKID